MELALSRALKEWAVVVRAMDEGRQIVLFRKGGIHERGFSMEDREFLLYPTYEHQGEDVLQPQFHPYLREANSSKVEGKVYIKNWARVEGFMQVLELERLRALHPYYILSPSYMEERFRWLERRRPLNALILRVFRLPQPMLIEELPRYGGCRSWVGLDVAIPISGSAPVLPEEEFFRRMEEIKRALADSLT